MKVQVSCRQPLPALVSCHAMILCFLSKTCCVPCDCQMKRVLSGATWLMK